MAARKLCLQSLSHFLQSSLYFFLPHASRKNAHSLLRYLGIRGMADTSFPFVFLRSTETAKAISCCMLSGRFWTFPLDRSGFPYDGGIFSYPVFQNRYCCVWVSKSTVLLRCFFPTYEKWEFYCVHTYRGLNHPSLPVRMNAAIRRKSRLCRAWQLLQSP